MNRRNILVLWSLYVCLAALSIALTPRETAMGIVGNFFTCVVIAFSSYMIGRQDEIRAGLDKVASVMNTCAAQDCDEPATTDVRLVASFIGNKSDALCGACIVCHVCALHRPAAGALPPFLRNVVLFTAAQAGTTPDAIVWGSCRVVDDDEPAPTAPGSSARH